MSVITDTWRQLVRRRLWPLAVLLLGALVAVPMLLAKSPSTPPATPAPVSAQEKSAPVGGGLESQPVVAVADASSRGRRHVLGAPKDPFAPAPQAKPKATPTPSVSTSTPSGGTGPVTPGGTPGGSTSPFVPTTPVGGSGGSGYTPPANTTPITPTTPTTPATPPKPKLAPGTLIVRFGDATSDSLPSLHVKKLDALPDLETPVAIYLGPGRTEHSAQFLLDANVKPEGDGSCRPSPADCQTVELREGDTEFLDVAADAAAGTQAAQYELDLVKVGVKPKKAKSSEAHHARASHARAARVGVTIARVVRLLHP